MDWEVLIPIVSAALGVLLGAFARELGVVVQIGREDKRVLKRVLFRQLDLWGELWRADFGLLVTLFNEEMAEALRRRGANPEQARAALEGVRPQLVTMFAETKPLDLKKLFDDYQETVKDLAGVAPVTAFRINRRFRGDFRETFNKLIGRAQEVEAAAGKAPLDQAFVERWVTDLSETSLREMIRRLEEDQLEIARLVGWGTGRDVRRRVKRMQADTREDVREAVEKLLGGLVRLQAEGGLPAQAPPPEPPASHGE